MNKRDQNEGLPDPRKEYLPLAQWLQQVLAITPPEPKAELTSITDNGGRFGDDYHSEFYRQLPDFVLALLNNDTQATLRFAPLLFHLIGCPTCHAAYLEIYDAMRATIVPGEIHMPAGKSTDLAKTIVTNIFPNRWIKMSFFRQLNQLYRLLNQGQRAFLVHG